MYKLVSSVKKLQRGIWVKYRKSKERVCMALSHSPKVVTAGLRNCTDNRNIKSYTGGSAITDIITNSTVSTNTIPNSAVSWLNSGVNNITLTAVVTRLTANAGYATNPFYKYVDTSNNTFNLYMFGNFNNANPGDDGRLWYYSNVNGSWAAVGSSYVCQINETVMFTLQYNSSAGGQTWTNGSKVGSRSGNGRFGSVGNTSNLTVFTPPETSVLTLHYTAIYDRELSDAEITQNYNALRGRYRI
jgi:hypothetical protein